MENLFGWVNNSGSKTDFAKTFAPSKIANQFNKQNSKTNLFPCFSRILSTFKVGKTDFFLSTWSCSKLEFYNGKAAECNEGVRKKLRNLEILFCRARQPEKFLVKHSDLTWECSLQILSKCQKAADVLSRCTLALKSDWVSQLKCLELLQGTENNVPLVFCDVNKCCSSRLNNTPLKLKKNIFFHG